MPSLDDDELARLGAYLLEHLSPDPDHWAGVPCDHTLHYTLEWLTANGFDVTATSAALTETTAYCDCAVLLNLVLPVWWPAPQSLSGDR